MRWLLQVLQRQRTVVALSVARSSRSSLAGGLSNSPDSLSSEPAIGVFEDQVCLAWNEAADRESQVLVRCHAWDVGQR